MTTTAGRRVSGRSSCSLFARTFHYLQNVGRRSFPRALKILIPGFAAAMLFVLGATLSQDKKIPYEEWKNWHSLKSVSKRTKNEGKNTVVIPGPRIEYGGENMTLEDAFAKSSVVVAEPFESKSSIFGDDHIITWYRCRLVDTISIRPPLVCDSCPQLLEKPADIKPTELGEVLIPKVGGTGLVDGVRVTMRDVDMPDFELHKRYLVFVSISPDGVARLLGGPTGVFRLTDDDLLEPMARKSRLKSEIENRFNLKLSKLGAHFKF